MERTEAYRERLIANLQTCRREDAAEMARLRRALEEIAGKHDGGEFPDSYQLGLREAAFIARTALSAPSPDAGE